MHILMMLFGALSALGFLIWRIQAASHAAREIHDFAKGAANLPRKLAFRRRTGKAGSSLVEDPREAAVIIMLEMARATGEVTREQKDAIEALLCRNFGFSESEAEEVLTQAAWVSASEAGTDALMRRMTRLIVGAVSHEDVIELDGMLVELSETEGRPSESQLDVLQSFRALTGIQS